jgi:hypothetical protein
MGYNNHIKDEVIRRHINEGFSTRALALRYEIGLTTIQNETIRKSIVAKWNVKCYDSIKGEQT